MQPTRQNAIRPYLSSKILLGDQARLLVLPPVSIDFWYGGARARTVHFLTH